MTTTDVVSARRYGTCTVEGCERAATVRAGLCNRHLYGTCTVEDCGRVAAGPAGLCTRHRYGTCTRSGCDRSASGPDGLCKRHRYGTCTVEDCGREATGPAGLCQRHRYGTCTVEDCGREATGPAGLCHRHRYGTCIADDCAAQAAGPSGLCERHGAATRARRSIRQSIILAARSDVEAQGRTLVEVFPGPDGRTWLRARCNHGHESVQRWSHVRHSGYGCPSCRTRKMSWSLDSFRTGAADPARPLALYIYEIGGLGKVGIGRPLDYWERRRKGLPSGRKLHRAVVPALVASTAEEILLSLLQGDEYGRGPDVPPTLENGNTERFRMEAYYLHRREVEDIFRWAEDPSSLDDLLSILHTPTIDPYFGGRPPTTPPTFIRQETA